MGQHMSNVLHGAVPVETVVKWIMGEAHNAKQRALDNGQSEEQANLIYAACMMQMAATLNPDSFQ